MALLSSGFVGFSFARHAYTPIRIETPPTHPWMRIRISYTRARTRAPTPHVHIAHVPLLKVDYGSTEDMHTRMNLSRAAHMHYMASVLMLPAPFCMGSGSVIATVPDEGFSTGMMHTCTHVSHTKHTFPHATTHYRGLRCQ